MGAHGLRLKSLRGPDGPRNTRSRLYPAPAGDSTADRGESGAWRTRSSALERASIGENEEVIRGLIVAVGVIVTVCVAVGLGRRRGRTGDHRTRPDPVPIEREPSFGLDPTDTATIGATLEAIGQAHADAQCQRLVVLVDRLIERRVPARVVDVVPGAAEGRVRFADGTTVRARGMRGGDLGILAAVVRECSALPITCSRDGAVVSVEFDHTLRQVVGQARTVWIRVIGVDQPD